MKPSMVSGPRRVCFSGGEQPGDPAEGAERWADPATGPGPVELLAGRRWREKGTKQEKH